MPEPLTEQQMNDLRARILAAKEGTAPMPSREELLAAYNQLRSDRTLMARKGSANSKPSAIPSNLNDLFS
ncbi:MAG: hypothetical protein ACWGQW_20370 [bacterium]